MGGYKGKEPTFQGLEIQLADYLKEVYCGPTVNLILCGIGLAVIKKKRQPLPDQFTNFLREDTFVGSQKTNNSPADESSLKEIPARPGERR